MRYRIKFRYKSLSCFLLRHTSLPKKVVKSMWVNGGRINQPSMPYVQYIIGLSTNNKLTSNKQDCIRRKSYILRIKSNTTELSAIIR